MASVEETSPQGGAGESKENLLMMNTIQALDEEKETILTEVLKCVICMELPKQKQVRICEKGHHFCMTCHKKMKVCGICRGKLLQSRNFAVEELVMKLGPILAITKSVPQQPPQPPAQYTPGSYPCPHPCSAKMPAHLVLPHLRDKHCAQLIDKVRSNPYSGEFCVTFEISVSPDKEDVWVTQVSDMGLFVIVFNFVGLNLFGWVKALGDKTVSGQFKYQLLVRIPTSNNHVELGVYDCDVASYHEEKDAILAQGNLLKVKAEDLAANVGGTVSLIFSVWRTNRKRKNKIPQAFDLCGKNVAFVSDRSCRRNRSRNLRRKKVREKYRRMSENDQELARDLNSLVIS